MKKKKIAKISECYHVRKNEHETEFVAEYYEDGTIKYKRKISPHQEWWYDEKGRLIHHLRIEFQHNEEKWYDFEDDKLVHEENEEGIEIWYDYDSMGRKTHWINSKKIEGFYTYDENGNLTNYRTSDGKVNDHYEYDSAGNKTYWRDKDGKAEKIAYDINGREIYHKYINCGGWNYTHDEEYQFEYDENGNKIHAKQINRFSSDGEFEEFWEYNKDNKPVKWTRVFKKRTKHDHNQYWEYNTNGDLIHRWGYSEETFWNYQYY